MPTQWSSLAILAAISALITLTGWLSPPGAPLWLVFGLAILATTLVAHGPGALVQVIAAIADAIERWRAR
ncbi:hypothetical protein [Nocardioides sp. L-11A]|uniref:hypothetical protein n=1 Tax=Nocardioides sp. L-11A TaxID=3043848 RepID=UPI00249C23F2|nr:hypothetical protein QJ852_21395 [Nocardioides sp. L-11A]